MSDCLHINIHRFNVYIADIESFNKICYTEYIIVIRRLYHAVEDHTS